MIKSLFLLLIVFISLHCQHLNAEPNSAPLIEKSNLLMKFDLLDIAEGEFQQKKFFKVLNHPIESNGTVFLDIEQGFIWQTNFPVHSKMLLKPSGLYASDGDNELQKINGATAITQVLMNVMTGNLQALTTEFTIQPHADSKCLSLKPLDDLLKNIILKIDICGDSSIDKIQLFEQSGNRTEITLKLHAIDKLPEAISAQLK